MRLLDAYRAHTDGYISGLADRLLSYRSEYAWYGLNDSQDTYSYWYCHGYHAAWI